MSAIQVKCDAAVWPNPGPGSCAYAIRWGDQLIALRAVAYGSQANPVTNNAAEYHAVELALRELIQRKMLGAQVQTDSQLVVKQVSGEWDCKSPLLEHQRDRVRDLLAQAQATLTWIPREQNVLADKLSGWCLPPASLTNMKQKLNRKHA